MTGWNDSQSGTGWYARKLSRVTAHVLLAASLIAIGGCPDPFTDANTATGSGALAITSTDPAANASGVPVNNQVSATASNSLDCASVSTTSFSLAGPNGAVSGTTDCTGNQAIFRPTVALAAVTEYTATLSRVIRDQLGNTLAADYTWRFTTGVAPDKTPPAVTSTDPTNGASGVELNKQISAIFSENLDCASVSPASFTITGPNGVVSGTTDCTDKQVAFTPSPSVALAPLSSHTAVLKKAIKDSAGNMMVADYTWGFTTGAAPDTTPPVVLSTDPANNATGVGTGKTLTASFSEALDCTSVVGNFRLNAPSGPVAGTTGCSGSVANFTPSATLAADSTHTATLTADIRDAAQNRLGSEYQWSFRTAPPPDTAPPTVTSRDPAAGASNVPLGQIVGATFSETLDCSTVNESSFLLSGPTGGIAANVACATDTATLTPDTSLQPSTTYMVTLTTAIRDPAGNALASSTWSFTTITPTDTTPPTVKTTDPGDGAIPVPRDITLSATFSEPITCDPKLKAFLLTKDDDEDDDSVKGKITCAGDQASFTPDDSLDAFTRYNATLNSNIRDLAGNALAPVSWSFTTGL